MLTNNEKKEYIKQAKKRRRTRQPEVLTKTIDNSNKKHPNYQREWRKKHPNYQREWRKKHPNYQREWRKKHLNYMKDYLKEWRSNVKKINPMGTLKIEDVDLAVVSEQDKSIYREIDETMRKEFASKQDGL